MEDSAGPWQRLAGGLRRLTPAELAARLTCLTLLFSPVGDWFVRPAAMALAGAGLLLPGAWRSPWLWGALALLTGTRVISDWPLADNHAYLLFYWCVALAVAAALRDPEVLARNARLLIGLMFAAAAWQKWTSPDYPNDVFFLTTFLLDPRFTDFTLLFTTLTPEQIEAGRAYLEALYREPGSAPPFPFPLPAPFRLLATASTWWNLFEQTLVAASFLAPPASRLGRLRDAAMLLFCFTIYAVAPVPSFGWLLLAMTAAQGTPTLRARLWLLGCFAILGFYYEVPWAGLLLDLRAAP